MRQFLNSKIIYLSSLVIILAFSSLIVTASGSAVSAEEMLITYRAPESLKDKRYDYDLAVLKLALDKTIPEYGNYRLVPSEVMNFARAVSIVENNKRTNFFIKQSYDNNLPQTLSYVPFPVDLGIVGYRVCFISPEANQALPLKSDLAELRNLTHAQGRGWIDVDILRHNGFTVYEINNYESLFYMVANSRVDLFCRGINELYHEYDKFKHIRGLEYDRTFMLVYELPRFFYSHSSNKEALERINKGLLRAYNDGSLIELWNEKYGKSVEFSHPENRTIYHLKNPKVDHLDFDYSKYFYRPDHILK